MLNCESYDQLPSNSSLIGGVSFGESSSVSQAVNNPKLKNAKSKICLFIGVFSLKPQNSKMKMK